MLTFIAIFSCLSAFLFGYDLGLMVRDLHAWIRYSFVPRCIARNETIQQAYIFILAYELPYFVSYVFITMLAAGWSLAVHSRGHVGRRCHKSGHCGCC